MLTSYGGIESHLGVIQSTCMVPNAFSKDAGLSACSTMLAIWCMKLTKRTLHRQCWKPLVRLAGIHPGRVPALMEIHIESLSSKLLITSQGGVVEDGSWK